MVVREGGRVICVRPMQFANAYSPRVTRLGGSVTETNPHSLNAAAPISVRRVQALKSAIVIAVPTNASSPR